MTLGQRIAMELAEQRQRDSVERVRQVEPTGEYCRWPLGREGISGWDVG